MRAKFIYENINFGRGRDPKSAMGIGLERVLGKGWDQVQTSNGAGSMNLRNEPNSLALEIYVSYNAYAGDRVKKAVEKYLGKEYFDESYSRGSNLYFPIKNQYQDIFIQLYNKIYPEWPFIKESLDFERGKNPKDALNLGSKLIRLSNRTGIDTAALRFDRDKIINFLWSEYKILNFDRYKEAIDVWFEDPEEYGIPKDCSAYDAIIWAHENIEDSWELIGIPADEMYPEDKLSESLDFERGLEPYDALKIGEKQKWKDKTPEELAAFIINDVAGKIFKAKVKTMQTMRKFGYSEWDDYADEVYGPERNNRNPKTNDEIEKEFIKIYDIIDREVEKYPVIKGREQDLTGQLYSLNIEGGAWGTNLDIVARLLDKSWLKESLDFERGVHPKEAMNLGSFHKSLEGYDYIEIAKRIFKFLPRIIGKDTIPEDILLDSSFHWVKYGDKIGKFLIDHHPAIGGQHDIRNALRGNPFEVLRKILVDKGYEENDDEYLPFEGDYGNLIESVNFERGLDPKQSLGIGLKAKRDFESAGEAAQWLVDFPKVYTEGEIEEWLPSDTKTIYDEIYAISRGSWSKLKILKWAKDNLTIQGEEQGLKDCKVIIDQFAYLISKKGLSK